MTKKIFVTVIIIFSNILWSQTEKAEIQNEFKLKGDIVSFPITIVNSFPFISAEINEVKGNLMFDTGMRDALIINNNIIPLKSQKEKGSGFVASGQKFKSYTNDNIEEVSLINGLHFQNLKQIRSANYDFLQNNIIRDCIGYIGHDFFKGYVFKLDYTKRILTFYKNTNERELSKDFLNEERLISIMDFETRTLPNQPMIKVKAGDIDILASFDTGGNYGGLELTDKDIDILTKGNYFKEYGEDGDDDKMVSLSDVKMNDQLKINFIGIYKESREDNLAVRKTLGITEENYMTIAYRFLAQYKTIWDYDHKKIYVLEY